MTSPITLQSLPPEIHLAIIDHLPWPAITSLRLSSSTFSTLLPPPILSTLHNTLANHLYTTEEAHLARLDSEFWTLAEQVFLGTSPNYFSNYAGDPDLEATSKRYTCSSETLPCYTCLRWLPSSTAPATFATDSAFTRRRSTGQFDLGGKRARERMCVECGVRKGVYGRGLVVKWSVVCLECGGLGRPISWTNTMRPKWEGDWWRGWFCDGCWGGEGGKGGKVRMSREQVDHERRWGAYEKGLAMGKEYRREKGRKLRRERGVLDVGEDERDGVANGDSGRDGRGPNARYCPIMGEKRFCFCKGK